MRLFTKVRQQTPTQATALELWEYVQVVDQRTPTGIVSPKGESEANRPLCLYGEAAKVFLRQRREALLPELCAVGIEVAIQEGFSKRAAICASPTRCMN
jgi:hypothetical protein